jgi:hypothetical protein
VTLEETARAVDTQEAFIAFLHALHVDHETNGQNWENTTLSSFLEAATAWSTDMSGYYRNMGQDPSSVPPWRIMADILMAARIYE